MKTYPRAANFRRNDMTIQLRPYQQTVHDDTAAYLKKGVYKAPAYVEGSVGCGKSILIAFIAQQTMEKGGKVLVLQHQGELCHQNWEAAWNVGVQGCCYSASLGAKKAHKDLVFGTRGTVARALNKGAFGYNPQLAEKKFHLILIDECHLVDYDKEDSEYMTIINHYKAINPNIRIIGYTGSPYRGMNSIKGDFWDRQLSSITTSSLIDQGFLVPPVFGFGDEEDHFDYSSVETKKNSSSFDEKELNSIAMSAEGKTKTHQIMEKLVRDASDRKGVLIFAATQRHCKEIEKGLIDAGVSVEDIFVVTESTKPKERMRAISEAKIRKVYLINVGVLVTGVNIPRIDTVVYLRPVGSIVLLIQSLGRGLRLCEETGKTDCLVLDYAGCFERLGNVAEDPLIEEAQYAEAKSSGSEDFIQCPVCAEENRSTARRCKGHDSSEPDGRCAHFWVSQDCRHCNMPNDINAQECRSCGGQLKDPNEALLNKAYTEGEFTDCKGMNIKPTNNGGLIVEFIVDQPHYEKGNPRLFFPIQSDMGRKIFYNNFFKVYAHHAPKGLSGLMYKGNAEQIIKQKAIFSTPSKIAWRLNEKGNFIVRPRFLSGREG